MGPRRKRFQREENESSSLLRCKKTYATASIIAGNRVVFNIKGNDYRLIVKFNYQRQWPFIRFVETHADYDRVDAVSI